MPIDISKLRSEINSLNTRIEALNKERVELQNNISTLRSENIKLKEQLDELNKEKLVWAPRIEALNKERAELQNNISTLRSENIKLKEQLDELNKEKLVWAPRIEALNKERAELQNNISTLRSENIKLKEQLDSLRSERSISINNLGDVIKNSLLSLKESIKADDKLNYEIDVFDLELKGAIKSEVSRGVSALSIVPPTETRSENVSTLRISLKQVPKIKIAD